MKKQATAVEQIDFNKLRRDLQTLMEGRQGNHQIALSCLGKASPKYVG